MAQVIMNTARTENGYSCVCDLLPGWVVACSGDFEQFKKEVEDSIKFYVDCAKEDGDEYPSSTSSPYLSSIAVSSHSHHWKPLQASIKSSWPTMHQASASRGPSRPRRFPKAFTGLPKK